MSARGTGRRILTMAIGASQSGKARRSVIYPALIVLVAVTVLVVALTTAAFADTVGPFNPTSAVDNNGNGSITWTNPGNITTVGSPYATASLTLYATSHYLYATGFNFNIPSTATINGVQVSINRYASGGSVTDSRVRLIKGGSVQSTDRASGTAWPTTLTVANYGTTGDLWGSAWTPADINASNFGVALSVVNGTYSSRTATVDYIQVTVTYTLDTTPPTVSSIAPSGNNPSNATSKDFTVTFAEPVNGGRDLSNYGLTPNGVTGTVINTVTGADGSNTRIVNVTIPSDSGEGTVRLDLVNPTGISDLAGNAMTSTFTGTALTVDRTPPSVVSISPAGSNPTTAGSSDFTVTFDTPVSGVAATNFGLTTTGFTTAPSITSVSGTAPSATWTVTVNNGRGGGTIRLDLPNVSGIQDVATNALSGTFNTGTVLTVDRAGGPGTPGTGGGASSGSGTAWTPTSGTLADALSGDDSNNATCALSGSGTSAYLDATNFGFNIPTGAAINGISVLYNRYSSSSSGTNLQDTHIQLLKGGVRTVTDKAATSTNWTNSSSATAPYGGASDTWGTGWSAADINSSSFGVSMAIRNSSSSSSRTAYVDYVQISVTYTLDHTAPVTATVTVPANGSTQGPNSLSFSGSAADNSGGGGLAANSTTFSLQRNLDSKYWNSSTRTWQTDPCWLATTHAETYGTGSGTTWTGSATMPDWSSEINGTTYTVTAEATDKAGNAFTGSPITFTLENVSPLMAFVISPASNLYSGSAVLTFSGVAADNTGGLGLAANSTTFTITNPAGQYWTGSGWQASLFGLPTIHAATTSDDTVSWTSSATLPNWATQMDGTYTVNAIAKDKAANTFTGPGITFQLDRTAPGTATVTLPGNGGLYRPSALTSFSGQVADSNANGTGSGVNADTTTFTLQRGLDGKYWGGLLGWQDAPTPLATTHSATTGNTPGTWTSAAILPTWGLESDGTFSVRATATDKAGYPYQGPAVTFTLDKTAPEVTSINPVDKSTQASSADFTVIFGEPVLGLAVGNFHAIASSGISSADVTGVSPVGGPAPATTWTVTVSIGHGNGTIRLDLDTLLGGINDRAGNPLAVTHTGDSVLIVDGNAPTTASVTSPEDNQVCSPSTVPGFLGQVADNDNGGGLAANSATFVLQRDVDGKFWTGSTWQVTLAALPTTHAETIGSTSETWHSAATLPVWTSQDDGAYNVWVIAEDKAGNTTTGDSITFRLDRTAPATATVTSPADGSFDPTSSVADFSGQVADSNANGTGSGLNANSTTFTLQRGSDSKYWDGVSTWLDTATPLHTTHGVTSGENATTWHSAGGMLPDWDSQTDGTYSVRATATDKADHTYQGSAISFTLDNAAPTVSSITPVDNSTKAASADFTVAFNEPVTGVAAGNFHLTLGGTGVTGTGVTGVVPVGGTSPATSWTVTVSIGGGDGTIRLDLDRLLGGITDRAGNTVTSTYTAGKLLYVDGTAPDPADVTITSPLDGRLYSASSMPAVSGSVADNPGGGGLAADSTTFTLQRTSDSKYWTGSAWGTQTQLATVHDETVGDASVTWQSAPGSLPAWSDQEGGSYTIQVMATDKAGNNVNGGSVGFRLDPTAPATASVTAPSDGAFDKASALTGFSGQAADDGTNGTASGLAADSTTFTLQRGFDHKYWDGVSLWTDTATPLHTTHGLSTEDGSVTWQSATGTLPAWASQTDGTYTVKAKAEDNAGNTYEGSGVSFVLDKTAPSVTSINPLDKSTHAASADFTVVFSEPVLGVTMGNFTVTPGGLVSGAHVTSVSGTGPADTWTVSVTTGSGEGTIRLDLNNVGTITDRALNSLSGVHLGDSDLIIDATAAGTASVTSPIAGTLYSGSSVPAFAGEVADNTGGGGLAANSTTFTIANPSGKYWTGSTWQDAPAPLATTHDETIGDTKVAWNSAATLPTWASQADGTYTVQATATDKAGNPYPGPSITFKLDRTAPATATVVFPQNDAYGPSALTGFSGQVADSNANGTGSGVNANTTKFTLKRGVDNKYWDGVSAWQDAATPLATTHSETSGDTPADWHSADGTLPSWSSQDGGTYVVQATVIDKAGYTDQGPAVTFTLDKVPPTTASVTAPINGDVLAGAEMPVISGQVADNPSGSGLDARSTTFTLQNPSGRYWNGSGWQAEPISRPTTHIATTGGTTTIWAASGSLPAWGTELDGVYTVQATATDKAGNTYTGDSITFRLHNTVATVLRVTSTKADGNWGAGTPITVQVVFSEAVWVTGTPQLTLSTGSPTTTALSYVSGSGGDTLLFDYTVATGNYSSDLDYASAGALVPNGGTIKDIADKNASLTLAAPGGPNSLSNGKALFIDAAAPTASMTTPADGDSHKDGAMPTTISGSVADNLSGIGVAADSVTFTVRRSSDSKYWSGSTWLLTATPLATVHEATGNTPKGWTNDPATAPVPDWQSGGDNTYTIQATAADTMGNASTTTVTLYDDNTGAASALLTSPAAGSMMRTATMPATLSGTLADNAGGGGIAANSTSFTLKNPSNQYWDSGTHAWGSAPTPLTATNAATAGGAGGAWTSSADLPVWGSQADGSYTVAVTITDKAGNTSTALPVTFTLDNTAPSVTITKAAGQADPTAGTSIQFTAHFSEAVTGVTSSDFTRGGTAGGTWALSVSGSGDSYTVTATGSGSLTNGTVTVTMLAGAAQDAAGNDNTAAATPGSVSYGGGPGYPGTGGGASNGTGSVWTATTGTLADALAGDDSNIASCSLTSSSTTSQSLDATHLGFHVPAGAVINGITVLYNRYSSSTSGTSVSDSSVRLLKGGAAVGNNKAVLGTEWSTTTSSTATYGSTSDTWGATWTADDINDPGFGVSLAATTGSTTRTAYVDYVRITVTYTLDTTKPTASITTPTVSQVVSGTSMNITGGASDTGGALPTVSKVEVAFQRPASGGGTEYWTGTPGLWDASEHWLQAAGQNSWSYNWVYDPPSQDGTPPYKIFARSTDAAGNISDSVSVAGVIVDNTAARVTNVTSTKVDGTYSSGDILIQVVFSESVTVTGTPRLLLTTGSGGIGTPDTTAVDYTSGSGSNTLIFTYHVVPGNQNPDLNYASTAALVFNGGSIVDAGGNTADLTLPALDAAGSLGTNKNLVIDTRPVVVNVTADKLDGTYASGDVPIQVVFSKPVYVTGVPQLSVATGPSSTTAVDYTPGDGTTTLTFTYHIRPGDTSLDLDYASSGAILRPGDADILDSATRAAILTLPAPGAAHSLGANKNIIVASVPIITNVSSPFADGAYKAGTVIPIEVTYTESVHVDTSVGTPTLKLRTSASGTELASYVPGPDSNKLIFNYTVMPGDEIGDLDYDSANALELHSGTIKSVATSSNTLLLLPTPGGPGSLGANKNILIDTTAPTDISISTPTPPITFTGASTSIGGTAADAGGSDVSKVEVSIQRPAAGGGMEYWAGTPGAWDTSEHWLLASGTTTWGFTWTFDPASQDGDTIYTIQARATDGAGNMTSSLTKTDLKIDNTGPRVTKVDSTTPDGNYGLSAPISIQVYFSEPVVVTGTPTLTLSTGSPATTAVNYTGGTTTSVLTFTYTVATGNYSGDLACASAGALAGTIKDTMGNVADLTLPAPGVEGSLSYNRALVIDAAAPSTASVVAPVSNGTEAGYYSTVTGHTLPTNFSGSSADNAGGVGLAANSTTFSLRKGTGNYWNGTDWSSSTAVPLATTHDAATGNTPAPWQSAVAMPNWATETNGTYTVQAKATDLSGNTFSGTAITFTLDTAAPNTATVTTPTPNSLYPSTTMPTVFHGSVADVSSTGAGIAASSTTFTLQRYLDGKYWNGTTWVSVVAPAAPPALPAFNGATTGSTSTTWDSTGTVPSWGAEGSGDYFVRVTAHDRAGNTFTGSQYKFTLLGSSGSTGVSGVDGGGTGLAWANAPSIAADDGINVASCSVGPFGSGTSNFLNATNFGVSGIPSNAVLDGLTVNVNGWLSGVLGGSATTTNAKLLKAGAQIGPNKTSGSWPTDTASIQTYSWTAAELSSAGVTLADLSNANFGFAMQVSLGFSLLGAEADVDYIQMAVSWHVPLDTTPPVVTILSPTMSQIMTSTFTDIAGTATDKGPYDTGVASVQVAIKRDTDSNYWNGTTWVAGPDPTWLAAATSNNWADWTYHWVFDPSYQDGSVTYTVSARGTDKAMPTPMVSDPVSVAGLTISNMGHLTVAAVTDTKVYDGGITSTVKPAVTGGLYAGDYVDTNTLAQQFDTKNAGTGKTLSPLHTAVVLGADHNPSTHTYSFDYLDDTTGTITAKLLTGTFTAAPKEYDQTTNVVSAVTPTLPDALAGDDVQLSLGGPTLRYEDSNAGIGKIITITNASPSLYGGDYQLGNYALDPVNPVNPGHGDITKKALGFVQRFEPDPRPLHANDRAYDHTTNATVTWPADQQQSDLSGVISGDVVSYDHSGSAANFETARPGYQKVNVTGVVLTGAAKDNYSPPSVLWASITGNIVDVHFTAANKVYDGTNLATITGAYLTDVSGARITKPEGYLDPSALDVTYSPVLGAATFSDKDAALAKPVTAPISSFTLTGLFASGDGAYQIDTVSQDPPTTADITPLPVVITPNAGQTKIYGATDPSPLTFTYLPTLVSPDGFVAGTTLGRALGEDVGAYAINLGTLSAGPNYKLSLPLDYGTNPVNFTITPATLQVNADELTAVYGDPIPALTYTLTGFQRGDTKDTAGITGVAPILTRVGGTSVGDYLISVPNTGTLAAPNYTFQVGSPNYLHITKRPLTITAKDQTKVYGDSFSFTGLPAEFTTSAMVGTESVASCTLGSLGTAADAPMGDYDITISGAVHGDSTDLANYNITYVKGKLSVTPQAITVTAVTDTKEYDGTTDPSSSLVKPTLTGALVTGDVPTLTQAFTDPNVGTGKTLHPAVTIKNASDVDVTSSYNVTLVDDSTGQITPKALTITADNQSKTYGYPFTFQGTEFTTSGLVNNEKIDACSIGSTGAAASATVVGSPYDITISDAVAHPGTLLTNYTVSYPSGHLTVTKRAITVTAAAASKGYDGDTTSSAIPTVTTGSLATDDVGTYTESYDNANVGTTHVMTPVVTKIENASHVDVTGSYDITPATIATGEIIKRPITVTAVATTKEYDGKTTSSAVPTLSSGTPLAAGDAGAYTETYDTKDVGSAHVMTPTATITRNGGASDVTANYAITLTPVSTGVITAKALSITANDQTKAYNTIFVFHGDEFTASGLVGTESITSCAIDSIGAPAIAGLGTYDIIITDGSAVPASNTDLNNYAVTYHAGQMTVSQQAITITAVTDSKVYDGTTNSIGIPAVSGDLLSGDEATTSQTFDTSSAGSGKTLHPSVTIMRGGVGGEDVTNQYGIIPVDATGEISKRPITVIAAPSTKEYDGDATSTATPTLSPTTPLANNQTGTYTESYDTASVGSHHTMTPVAAITNASFDVVTSNYDITYQTIATGEITPKALTVTAKNQTKTYGDVFTFVNTADFTASGLVVGESITSCAIDSTGAPANAAIGTYDINIGSAVPGSNTSLSNYTVSYHIGHLAVGKRAITVTAAHDSKPYDGGVTSTATPTLSLITPLANGDTGTYTQAFTTKDVDTGKTLVPTAVIKNGSNVVVTANYDITPVNDTTGVISAKALDITAKNQTKILGTTFSFTGGPAEFTTSGLVVGESITSCALASTGAVVGAGLGTYDITIGSAVPASNTDLNNYAVTYHKGQMTVSSQAITVTAVTDSRAYDGTKASDKTPQLTLGSLVDGDVGHYSQTFDSATVGTGKTLTPVVTITRGVGGADVTSDYAITYNTVATGEITKRPITVTAVANTKTYDGTTDPSPTSVKPTVSPGGVASTDTASLSESFDSKNAGPRSLIPAITISNGTGDVSNQYDITLVNASGTISAKALSITASNRSKTYGDAVTFAGTEFTPSGLVGGDTVTSVTLASTGAAATAAVNTYPIVPSAAVGTGLGNYTITYTNGTLTVSAKALSITANNRTKTYGTALTMGTTEFSVNPGDLVNGDTVASVTLTSTGAAATAAVNTYPIIPSAALAGIGSLSNYTITYHNGTLTVNAKALDITANDRSKTYGTAVTFAGTEFTPSGLVNGDTVASVTLASTGVAATAAVNTYPIIPSAAVAGIGSLSNYTITYHNGTLTVNAKALSITASNRSKTYGDAVTFAGTEFTPSGLVGGDTVTSVTLASTGAAATAAVNTYPIVPSAAVGTGLGNYTITYTNGTLTVSAKALSITANNRTKTYGTALTMGTTEFSVNPGDLVNGDTVASVTLTSTGAAATAAVNTYPIIPSAALAGIGSLSNYTITYHNGTLTVNAKALDITANDRSKTYGTAVTFAGTEFTPSGLVNGDTVASVTLASTGVAATAAVNTYPIIPSAAVAGIGSLSNYTITYHNGTLTVNAKALSITASNRSKTYGDAVTFAGTEFTPSGLVGGDTVTSVTLASTGAAATAAVNTYPIVPSAAVGTGLGNYTITYTNGTLTVSAKALSITANNRTKTYGTALTMGTTEFSVNPGDLVNGDTVASVTLTSTGAAATAAVNTYPIIPSAALAGIGSLSNYTITYHNGTLTVNVLPITVTATSADKTYDGAASSSALPTVTSGSLVNGDVGIFAQTYSSANVGSRTLTPTVTSIKNGSTDVSGNYSVTLATATGSITAKVITITPTPGQSKTYGDPEPTAFAYSNTPLVGADAISGKLGRVAGETVAGSPYAYTLGTLSVSSNYSLAMVSSPATFAITIKVVTVSGITVTSKVYDGTTTATLNLGSAVLTGVLPADTANVSLATTGYTATFNTAAAGTGKAVTVSGLALTGGAAGNYTLTQPTGLTATITPAALTITGAVSHGKAYDTTTTASVTGGTLAGTIYSPDAPAIGTYTAHFASAAVGTWAVTVDSVTLTGTGAANYQVTPLPTVGSATITAAGIAVTVSGITVTSKVYDGTTTATLNLGSAVLTGVLPADTPNVSLATTGYTATFNTAAAGTGKAVTVSGLALTGSAAGNYTLTQPTGLTGAVTARPITITAVTGTKVYDGNTSSTGLPSLTLGTLAAGDVGTYTETYDNINVGTTHVMTPAVTSIMNGTTNNTANYTITLATVATGSITGRPITITAVTGTKVYDGTATSSGVPSLTSGTLATGDLGTYTQTYDNVNVGTTHVMTPAAAIMNGTTNNTANYTITRVTVATGAITGRPITITAVTSTKVYDGNTSSSGVPTLTSGTLASGDVGTYTQTYDTAAPGTGKTLTPAATIMNGTTNNTANYTITPVTNLTGSITGGTPTVLGVDPTGGSTAGGNTVTVTGTSFTGATSVMFGTTAGTGIVVNGSGTQLTVVAPAHATGTVHVTVTTPGGTSAAVAADQYTYSTITATRTEQTSNLLVYSGSGWAVFSTTGPSGGSYQRTLTGSDSVTINFNGSYLAWIATKGTTLGTASVSLDGGTATSVNLAATVVAYQQNVWQTPGSLTAGQHKVVITRTAATGKYISIDAVDVIGVLTPTVTALSVHSGTTAGGTSVVITGTGFLGLSGAGVVQFGGVNATSYVVNSATQITAVAPAHAAGLVQVKVTAGAGSSPNTAADDYTYATPPPAPTITSLNPTSGSTAGGNSVIITGTNLTGATAVTFGGTAATTFTVNSATQITATAPAHVAGTGLQVQVTTPGGSTANTTADDYTYVAPPVVPTITALSVHNGTTAGGTSVVITGTGFTGLSGAAAVTIGGANAATYVVNSATQITATTAAHAYGSGRVVVTTPAGSNADTTADDWAYTTRIEAPGAAGSGWAYSPSVGPAGGTAAWQPFTTASASGGNYMRSLTSGSYVTISFTGTYLAWIATAGTTTGVASVSVDGGTAVSVNLARTATNYQQRVWTSGTLANTTHTVKITWAAAAGKYIDVDAVEIAGTQP